MPEIGLLLFRAVYIIFRMVLLNFRQLKLSHEIPVESSKNILLSLQDNSALYKFGFCFVNVVVFFISSRGFLLKNITGPCFHVFDWVFFHFGKCFNAYLSKTILWNMFFEGFWATCGSIVFLHWHSQFLKIFFFPVNIC